MNFSVTNNLDDPRIISFLVNDERATIYHHSAWLRAVSKTFGHNAYYLLLENDKNDIEGLIPFITINSSIKGRKVVSLPFSTYCDPLIDRKILPDAVDKIRRTFPGFTLIEFRTLLDYTGLLNGFSSYSGYCTHILHFEENYEKTFTSFPNKSIKSRIRKADKYGLEIRWGTKIEDLKLFYRLEVSLRKRLGLPPLPFLFFKTVWQELSESGLISLPLVTKDKKVIAAGFILNFKDTFYLEYTAAEKKFLEFAPNHKLISEVIKKAILTGAARLDFGRSSLENKSLIKFKEQWNAEKSQIYHIQSPKKRINKNSQNHLIKNLMMLNKVLPKKVLEFEGKIVYPHLG